ncbi:MAG: hypothetical protein ACRCZ9_02120 [Fusobacteriaceae bacterium]
MNFLKKLFFISLFAIFLSGCQFLGVRKVVTADLAQEKFLELDFQYREILSSEIENNDLNKLQRKYQNLYTDSDAILFSESPDKKLTKKERTLLLDLKQKISKRSKILDDLKN